MQLCHVFDYTQHVRELTTVIVLIVSSETGAEMLHDG